MAIQQFRNEAGLSKYYFNTDLDAVVSIQSGKPRVLKWSQPQSWNPRRVSMVTNRGFKVNYTYAQIRNMLLPIAEQPKAQAVTNDLSMLKPDFEYVMYSVKNRCSQYFFAGTTVKEALERLAKRGEIVAPQDVRILNTRTGQVSTLKPQVVTTYVLA